MHPPPPMRKALRLAKRTALLEQAIAAVAAFLEEVRLCDDLSMELFGVTAAQLTILCALADEDEQSINDLAERSRSHQSSVSNVVRQLASKRLVSKTSNPVDRRQKVVRLTAKGRSIAKSWYTGRPLLMTALAQFPAESVKHFADLLDRLSAQMAVVRWEIRD